ncbi:MAG: hypothetical protein LUP97_04045 [Methanoregula sp.]|nr:hypothetical protein [Methanoregula sp.]
MLSGLHRPALRADRTETSIPYRGKIVNARDPAILISLQTVIDELNRIIRSGGAGAAIPPVREHKALKNKKK